MNLSQYPKKRFGNTMRAGTNKMNWQANSFDINNIFFSVLIPVYNVNKYLGKCIYSVLEQTYHNFEIILIDDGSTDQSGSICERYAKLDDRIKVFHQTNQGIIMTRRNALEKAMGDYVLFLDSDDYWDTDLLETINKAIWDYGCDMVIFNYKKITPNETYINEPVFENGSFFDSENKEQIFEYIIKGSLLNNLWIKAVKSTIIDYEDYSEYKAVKYAEDLLQSLPLLCNAKRILYLDKPMYNYRMNPTSLTHNFSIRSLEDITIVRGIVLKYMELLEMNEQKYLKLFYQNYINTVLSYLAKLNNSNIPIREKKNIMVQVQNISLYKNALPFLDGQGLFINQKIEIYLFKKKFYHLLILYEKAIQFIKLHF